MGIFILPSLLFYHLLFPIPSILFYLSLPSRDPVALNIGRHLYSDPGSIVKMFQHVMALWLLESPPGTLLQGPRVRPAVRVKKSRTFSQPCDRKCKLFMRLCWVGFQYDTGYCDHLVLNDACSYHYVSGQILFTFIFSSEKKKYYGDLFFSVTPQIIHYINLLNKPGQSVQTEVLCFPHPGDVALKLNFIDTSVISGQDNQKPRLSNFQKVASRSGHKLCGFSLPLIWMLL